MISISSYFDIGPDVAAHWKEICTRLSAANTTCDHIDKVTAIIYEYVKDLDTDLVIRLFTCCIKYLHGSSPLINILEQSPRWSNPFSQYSFDYPEIIDRRLVELVLAKANIALAAGPDHTLDCLKTYIDNLLSYH